MAAETPAAFHPSEFNVSITFSFSPASVVLPGKVNKNVTVILVQARNFLNIADMFVLHAIVSINFC
jgi:hypothetical protein